MDNCCSLPALPALPSRKRHGNGATTSAAEHYSFGKTLMPTQKTRKGKRRPPSPPLAHRLPVPVPCFLSPVSCPLFPVPCFLSPCPHTTPAHPGSRPFKKPG